MSCAVAGPGGRAGRIVPRGYALVVDLTADEFDAATLIESMRMGRELEGVPTVGFYPNVQQELRRRADEAGVDFVVPRSRMAREAPALVASLVGE